MTGVVGNGNILLDDSRDVGVYSLTLSRISLIEIVFILSHITLTSNQSHKVYHNRKEVGVSKLKTDFMNFNKRRRRSNPKLDYH